MASLLPAKSAPTTRWVGSVARCQIVPSSSRIVHCFQVRGRATRHRSAMRHAKRIERTRRCLSFNCSPVRTLSAIARMASTSFCRLSSASAVAPSSGKRIKRTASARGNSACRWCAGMNGFALSLPANLRRSGRGHSV
eukprot:460602-Prymnesium_polylepis.1